VFLFFRFRLNASHLLRRFCIPRPPPPRVFVPLVETPDSLVYARAFYQNDEQLQLLADYADLSETEVNTIEQSVLIEINASQVPEIEALGFRVEIDAGLTEEARLYAQGSMLPASIPRYACYRTVEETFDTAAISCAGGVDRYWRQRSKDGGAGRL
jgi:hypothetical protein